MKKLKLSLEDLKVESFETISKIHGKNGTVKGFDEYDSIIVCPQHSDGCPSNEPTCDDTCNPTCNDPTCLITCPNTCHDTCGCGGPGGTRIVCEL